jgi:hypothetical protein
VERNLIEERTLVGKTLPERVAVLEEQIAQHISHCVWWQRAIAGGVFLLIVEVTVRLVTHMP